MLKRSDFNFVTRKKRCTSCAQVIGEQENPGGKITHGCGSHKDQIDSMYDYIQELEEILVDLL